MRRVLLVHQPIGGGVARHVSDVASGLAARGCEVVVCGPAPPAARAADSGAVRHIRLALSRAVAPRADLAAAGSLARLVHRLRPDVVHAHSSKAGAIARMQRLSNPRVPVVYTPHGYAFASHFDRQAERVAYRELERVLAHLASLVVCVCEAEARLARSLGPAGRVRVVHNGVAVGAVPPADRRISELAASGPVVCALTLLRPGKGLDTLLDATPLIRARHPRAQIAIWGDGPDRARLQSRAARLGIGEAVRFMGQTASPVAAIAGSTVFVHPSLAEAFPYVILEAMSAGLPIVASDVGGIGEAIAHGHTGLLAAPGDPGALAQAVATVLDDTRLAAAMGAAARDRLERRFTAEAMLDGLVAAYDELAATGRPRLR